MPTASAVVSDVMEIARNVRDRTRGRLSPYSYQRRYVKKIRIKDIHHVDSRWYLRLSVVEGPRVLSRITGVLEQHDVGMMTVNTRAREADGTLPVVILTRTVRGRNVIRALRRIDQLPVISGKTVAIRIEDRFS